MTSNLEYSSQVALVVKNSPTNAGDITDVRSIPGLERSPGERYGNPFQYSCLVNPHGQRTGRQQFAKSWTQLSD